MIVHTIRNLNRQHGGVPAAVLGLLRQMASQTPHENWLLLAEREPNALLTTPHLAQNCVWHQLPESAYGRAFQQQLNLLIQKHPVELIHDHGIWLPHNRRIAQLSCQQQIPRVVSLHGMLEPWAWQYKAWKKRLAWHLFQHRDLSTAQVLHATSKTEADRLRHIFPHLPVAHIPLGIDLPPDEDSGPPPSTDSPRRTVLFLSRLHEKKGLLNLIEAWHQLPTKGWQLIIAGPDEQGYQAKVDQRIADLKLCNVEIIGPVTGSTKWQHYQQADLFVLPTHSENFGMVIAEALAAGTPVVTTQAAPWSDLVSYRCGWWIQTGVTPLINALRLAMAMDAAELAVMGQRGRALINEKYTWPQVATQMLELYQWMLGLTEKPDYVLSQKYLETI